MTMVTNQSVNDWVKEMAEMTNPDEIVWIDGSEKQLDLIKQIALETGEMLELNQEKLPGCLYYRTNPKRCCKRRKTNGNLYQQKRGCGPTNNWVSP